MVTVLVVVVLPKMGITVLMQNTAEHQVLKMEAMQVAHFMVVVAEHQVVVL